MKILVILFAGVSLASCTITQRIGDNLCKNREQVALAAEISIERAQQIKDPIKREAAISAARLVIASLSKCPEVQI